MTDLVELHCKNNKIKNLYLSQKDHLTLVDASRNTLLQRATLTDNDVLETLDLSNCTALTAIGCRDNALTSLSVAGCSALTSLTCPGNNLSDAAMTTIIGDLPVRSSDSPGTLKVLYFNNEGNVFTPAHLTAAQAKYWMPQRYTGTAWVDITFSMRGDVDGDGNVGIGDVTTLIDYLLSGNATDVDLTAADVDSDGNVGIGDVTTLIDYLLSGNWN